MQEVGMQNLIGQYINRYYVKEQLGQGGMAVVFKAYDTSLDREVAIKLIRIDSFNSELAEQMLKRFEIEAKSLAHMDHPSIIPIYDYGSYNGSPYLVMKFVNGGTLKEMIKQTMPFAHAARLLAPIAHALDYAHGLGIIHRDIKPANILVTHDKIPMLSDFGVAKILESNEGNALTSTGVGIGTPEYMAPEQWINQVVPQTDIYALGVVFYEMITGHKPYSADTPAAVILKQANDPLPNPRTFNKEIPIQVEQAILKALAKKPQDRYATMGEFASLLDQLASTSPTNLPLSVTSSKPAAVVPPQITAGADKNKPAPRSALKKILPLGLGIIALGILVIVCLGGWAAYTMFLQSTPTQVASETTSSADATSPAPAGAAIATNAPSFRVLSSHLSVTPTTYTGSCTNSMKFDFKGDITVNGPGTVTYHFVRSDGAVTQKQTLAFPDSGTQQLSKEWSFHSTKGFTGWEQIFIDSPNNEAEAKAEFTITCTH